jgi:hypothetical protein
MKPVTLFTMTGSDAVVLAVAVLAALPGLEVGELGGRIAQRTPRRHLLVRAIQKVDGDVELGQVGALGTSQALKQDVHRHALLQTGKLSLYMREHTALGRHRGALANGI